MRGTQNSSLIHVDVLLHDVVLQVPRELQRLHGAAVEGGRRDVIALIRVEAVRKHAVLPLGRVGRHQRGRALGSGLVGRHEAVKLKYRKFSDRWMFGQIQRFVWIL